MRLVETQNTSESLTPLEEQYDIASWEVLIKVLKEIGHLPTGDIDQGNSYILEFCQAFNQPLDSLFDKLTRWSSLNKGIAPTKQWSMFRIGRDLGFYDENGTFDVTAMASIEICANMHDDLTKEILDDANYQRFKDLIETSVEHHANNALNCINNSINTLDYLSNIREYVKYFAEEYNQADLPAEL